MQLPHKNEQTGLFSANDTWENFAEQLQERSNQPVGLGRWAKISLPELHQHLSSNSQYQYELALAKTRTLQRYSDSVLLFENHNIKASLVILENGRSLPLHDHPGASGMMFVVDGSVNICHCNAEPLKPGQPLSLNVVQKNTLEKNDVSWFTANEKNIHSIEAVSPRALLLVIHTPVFSSQQQSYYFPLAGSLYTGSRVQAQRINAHVLKHISNQNTSTHKQHKQRIHSV